MLIQLQWDNSFSLETGVILKFLELFRSYFVEFIDDIYPSTHEELLATTEHEERKCIRKRYFKV